MRRKTKEYVKCWNVATSKLLQPTITKKLLRTCEGVLGINQTISYNCLLSLSHCLKRKRFVKKSTLRQCWYVLCRLWNNPFQPSFQKHPKEVFCKICVLKNFIKLTGKGLCWSFFLNKVAGLKPASLFKKGLQHRCFSVNLVKLLRTLFTEHLPVTVEHLPVLHSI